MNWPDLLIDAWRAHEAEDFREATKLSREAAEALAQDHGDDAARPISRLLANAIYSRTEFEYYKCPRCEIEVIQKEKGATHPYEIGVAMSRVSRGDNDAPIPICGRCGGREAHRAVAAVLDPEEWRTGAGIQSPDEWPVPIEELLEEDRIGMKIGREAELTMMRPDEITGED